MKKSLTNFELNFEFQLNFQLRGCISRAGREDQKLILHLFPAPPPSGPSAHARFATPRATRSTSRARPLNTISDLEIQSTIEFQIATMPKNGLIPNENYKT